MLESNFVINHIKVDTMQRSEDGTVKKRGFVRWFGGRIGFDSYEYQNNFLCFQSSRL
jgi:hypothetical protein